MKSLSIEQTRRVNGGRLNPTAENLAVGMLTGGIVGGMIAYTTAAINPYAFITTWAIAGGLTYAVVNN